MAKKRFISVFVVLVVLLSVIPASASSANKYYTATKTKSVEFTNNSASSVTLRSSNNNKYEYAAYEEGGKQQSSSSSSSGTFNLGAKRQVVITALDDISPVEIYLGSELVGSAVTVRELNNTRANAYYTATDRTSFEFTNNTAAAITLRATNNNKYEYAEYEEGGKQSSSSYSTTGTHNIGAKRRVVITALDDISPVDIYLGAELVGAAVTVRERSNTRANAYFTVTDKKSFEFTNNTAASVTLRATSSNKYQATTYDEGGKQVSSAASTTGTHNIGAKRRTVLTALDAISPVVIYFGSELVGTAITVKDLSTGYVYPPLTPGANPPDQPPDDPPVPTPTPTPTPDPTPTPTPTPTPDPTEPPAPPTSEPFPGLDGFTVEQVDLVGIKLQWNAIEGSIGYRVYRSDAAGDLGVSATDFYCLFHEYIDVNVEPGEVYYYTVRQIISEATIQGAPETYGAQSAQLECRAPDKVIGDDLPSPGAEMQKKIIVMQIDDPLMTMANGNRQEIDPGRGTMPIIRNDRTLVPIRAIVEGIGGRVDWEESTREVTLTYRQNTVRMWLDVTTINVNGTAKTIDVAPTSINERTMVPIRFAAENLGCAVEFINSTRQVVIVYY